MTAPNAPQNPPAKSQPMDRPARRACVNCPTLATAATTRAVAGACGLSTVAYPAHPVASTPASASANRHGRPSSNQRPVR